jgi:hypothetical protein
VAATRAAMILADATRESRHIYEMETDCGPLVAAAKTGPLVTVLRRVESVDLDQWRYALKTCRPAILAVRAELAASSPAPVTVWGITRHSAHEVTIGIAEKLIETVEVMRDAVEFANKLAADANGESRQRLAEKKVSGVGPNDYDTLVIQIEKEAAVLRRNQSQVTKHNANDPRDSYIYHALAQGNTLHEIKNEVNTHHEWELIETEQGISQAAKRYAKRHGLTWPIPAAKQLNV